MPAHLSGNFAEAVALDSSGDDGLRLALYSFCAVESAQDRGHVVAVDYFCRNPFGLKFATVNFHVVLIHGGFALAQRVDVADDGEIIEFVMRSESSRLPNLSFGEFTVTGEHVHTRGTVVHSSTDGESGAH